jgi:hypothetical protein
MQYQINLLKFAAGEEESRSSRRFAECQEEEKRFSNSEYNRCAQVNCYRKAARMTPPNFSHVSQLIYSTPL